MLFPSLFHFLINPAHAELSVSELSAGDLVISEIMHDPVQVFDYKGEWLEIFNNSGDSVDLDGLILQDNSGETITVSGTLLVANGDYVVLGARNVSSQNGGAAVDYRYNRNSFRLNPSDAVILSNGSTTIDSVTYNTTSTFPPAVGTSLNLGSLSSDNSQSSSWCESSSSYGDGDLGTPGAANDSCGGLADLSAGDLIITELMPDPTKTADYRGEWFEIYNNTSSNINLNGLVIGGSGSDPGETVSDNVYVSPGGYALFAVRSGSFDNGGMTNVDYKYSYNNMKMLLNGDLVSISFGGTTFDSVSYTTTTVGGAYPSAVGQSISLSSTTFDASSNDNGSNWCTPTSTYGDGDFGTPGQANDACSNADADGDGFTGADGDCDDTNSSIFPGAPETCDGVDNNCSGDETDASDAVAFFADDDGDTYGDSGDTTPACSGDTVAGYVEGDSSDCDDTKSSVNPTASELCDGIDNDCDNVVDDNPIDGATYYLDGDGDGYGSSTSVESCDDPSDISNTYVNSSGDCDDSNSGINPGIVEDCSATEDLNCDGLFGNDVDTDGDGFTTCDANNPDCNDSDININPGATEVCDDVDNNCDGTVDESTASDALVWYADTDSDGFGDVDSSQNSCDPITGFVSDDQDCDDTRGAVYPGATETCDTLFDDNCDGDTNDVGAENGTTFYEDSDGDTHGNLNETIVTCTVPTGYVTSNDDCDDTSSSISPSAQEVCDGVDNDCDNDIDDADTDVDSSTGTTYFLDSDNDLYGDSDLANSVQACSLPAGYRSNSLDCDDSDYDIKPNALEICDGVDNDCDTAIDAADSSLSDGTSYYTDSDGDLFGDPATEDVQCPDTQPAGTVTDNTDCDDSDTNINPSATELVADNVDQNCDNQELCYVDSDTDTFGGISEGTSSTIDCSESGFSLVNTDCVDSDSNTFPGAAPNDSATECMTDADGDDYGDTSAPTGGSAGSDCDDSDASINATVTYFADTDTDGFGDSASPNPVCSDSAPSGFVTDNTDCDDSDININPSATELVADNVDQNCDNQELCYVDSDTDTFGGISEGTSSTIDCSESGFSLVNTDCVDSDSNTFPGAAPNDSATDCMTDADGDDYGDISAPTGGSAGTDCDDSDASTNANVTYFADTDGDGFGDSTSTNDVCSNTPPTGFVTDSTDCVDTDVNTFPGAAPNDSATDCMTDADGDDYGDTSAPTGGSAGTDCDDSDNSINATVTYFADTDTDGFGDSATTNDVCSNTPPSGFVTDNTDCVDSDINTFPGAAPNDSATECMTDADGDDYGDTSAPTGGSAGTDCDDSDAAVNSSATFYADTDGDGFGDNANPNAICSSTAPTGFVIDNTDCDDSDIAVNPDATEIVADSVDQNCDNQELCYVDSDTDGVGGTSEGTSSTIDCSESGFSLTNTDCDDADGTVTADQTYYTDSDGDGFGLTNSPTTVCSSTAPTGFADEDDDCDDTDEDRYPNAPETCNDGIDSDCDGGDNTQTCDSNLAAADSTILGENANDLLGYTLSHAGDLDGDGTPDFALGARTHGSGGAVYIFDGLPSSSVSASSADAKITGTSSEVFGSDMSGGLALSEFNIDGDINGDGNDDLIVGALRNDDNGTDAGAVYIFYGPITGNITTAGADAVLQGGASRDLLGRSVTMVGDVNGDSIADFLISAHKNDFKMSDSGRAYLFYGGSGTNAQSGTKSLELGAPPADVIFDTYFSGTRLGSDLAPAGDLTGDGINEILIGAEYYDRFNYDGVGCNPDPDVNPGCSNRDEGAAIVWQGGSFSSHRQFDFTEGNTSNFAAHALMLGEGDQDRVGYSVHGVGDVNGDGTNDFIAASPYYNGAGSDMGVAYVISGDASGVEDLGSSSNVISKIVGSGTNEYFGRSVGALGDINGDGTNDFVVGAKGADENGSDSGGAFIFLGPVSGTINSNTADSIFAGASAGDEVGTGVVTAGDLNGGGRPDILIGAHHYTSGSTFQGGAFIILGENY